MAEDNATELHKSAHRNSDVDFDNQAQHHTLGFGPNQAAPGSSLKALELLVAELEARVVVLEGGP